MQSPLLIQGVRVLAGVVLVTLLFGTLVLAGATGDEPMTHDYPNDVDVRQDRGAYVGEEVVVAGEIVETDPVVVATMASGHGNFTLVDADERVENSDAPIERGDQLTAFGTLEDESTLVVEQAILGDRDGTRYMFLVSALGGLLVAVGFVRHWRFDLSKLAFVARRSSEPEQDVTGGDSGRQSRSRGEQTARPTTIDETSRRQTERPRGHDVDGGERRG